MAVAIEKQIFGLQITIDDVMRMQIVESECDFCGVELGNGVGEALRLA